MGYDHRGRPTGRSLGAIPQRMRLQRHIRKTIGTTPHVYISDAQAQSVADKAKSLGADPFEAVYSAYSVGKGNTDKQRKQSQREQKLEGLKNAVTEKIAPYRVTSYETSREYGGPEEGGWYFDAGVPVEHSRGYLTRNKALDAAATMREEGDPALRRTVQRGKGRMYPETRPYYE